ncbi:hypothetical protein [Pedobacter frigiditerrae]|uniref:hypothetical protein n=1 Tax=Pedobacter frigiditerrae TaxID=2530452 RepID=UPI00292CB0E9|nr:hypothetical protein [Pedobacter frigiditerrae]
MKILHKNIIDLKLTLKNIIFFIFLLSTNRINAQSNISRIIGFVKEPDYKYAFLLLPERKMTIKTSIIEGKFDFEIDKSQDFEMGTIYFGIDSNRTYKDVNEKRNEGINETKSIVLDDSVKIYVEDNVNEAELIGGNDTKALNAMNEAIKTRKYTGFFEAFPESPITVFLLKIMLSVEKKTSYRMFVDYEKIYSNLPLRLKESKRGLEVKALLEK